MTMPSEQTTVPDTAHPSRFVRLRCPLCDDTSPACDQSTDVRRDLLARWWDVHKRSKHPFPRPIIERAEQTVEEVDDEHS